jgi:hypothetical protein
MGRGAMGNAAESMAVILTIRGAANDHHGQRLRGRWAISTFTVESKVICKVRAKLSARDIWAVSKLDCSYFSVTWRIWKAKLSAPAECLQTNEKSWGGKTQCHRWRVIDTSGFFLPRTG